MLRFQTVEERSSPLSRTCLTAFGRLLNRLGHAVDFSKKLLASLTRQRYKICVNLAIVYVRSPEKESRYLTNICIYSYI